METTTNKPKIYCFIDGVNAMGYGVAALSEDGDVLAGHCSSSEHWAQHDIGINSDWKHDKYKVKYPDGYELVWLDKEECHKKEPFLKAVEIANSKPEEESID